MLRQVSTLSLAVIVLVTLGGCCILFVNESSTAVDVKTNPSALFFPGSFELDPGEEQTVCWLLVPSVHVKGKLGGDNVYVVSDEVDVNLSPFVVQVLVWNGTDWEFE